MDTLTEEERWRRVEVCKDEVVRLARAWTNCRLGEDEEALARLRAAVYELDNYEEADK